MGCLKLKYWDNQEALEECPLFILVDQAKKDVPQKIGVNYSPFGALLPGRNFNSSDYKYGYQGSEMDNEIKGNGNSYTTEFRQLDPRLGRWLSIDPMASSRPSLNPYNSMSNNPISRIDPLGNIDDWVGCEDENGKIKWSYDKDIVTEEQAKELGYDHFKKDGSEIVGRINGGELGVIELGRNGNVQYVPEYQSSASLTNPYLSSNGLNTSLTGKIPKPDLFDFLMDHGYVEGNIGLTEGALGGKAFKTLGLEFRMDHGFIGGYHYDSEKGGKFLNRNNSDRTVLGISGGGPAGIVPIGGSVALKHLTEENVNAISTEVTFLFIFNVSVDFRSDNQQDIFIGLAHESSAGIIFGGQADAKVGAKFTFDQLYNHLFK